MNYYITHSDKNYVEVAEKLFESLKLNSKVKILYYTVNFHYKNKFDNVIPIYYKTDFKSVSGFDEERNILNNQESVRANLLFLKSKICNKALETGDHNFCYVDADCIAIKNCDDIFNSCSEITSYPLLGENCHEYMIYNNKGSPFLDDGSFDLNYCLEADLLKKLNIPIQKRTPLYRQSNILLYNKKCSKIINEWTKVCYDPLVISEWTKFACFNDETVLNCLLWRDDNNKHLNQISINIPCIDDNRNPVSPKDLDIFLNTYNNPEDKDVFCGVFCKIPSKDKIHNIRFLHGRVSEEQFSHIKNKLNFINPVVKNNKSNFIYFIHSTSLGDTIASTPVLRKLYKSYNSKIDIVTYHKDVFINNPYVNNIYEFSSFTYKPENYKQKFESFLGVGGIKNDLGVEKKHNTIDIRQFHALDLGFMLHENEMEYDYSPNAFSEIKDLPNNFICIHASNTWPSRTYADSKLQNLINKLNDSNIPVVLVGKNSIEHGFYIVDKQTKKLSIKNGLDLTNKLDLSQCWHVINKSSCFITMDSGLLHLAGTTDTNIIQLGSSINNKLRAPYRKGSQDYKYKYISGPCKIFCASDIKYGVKEWGSIQGVPPLINCLENKQTFECHPSENEIFSYIKENFENIFAKTIEVFSVDADNSVIHYRSLIERERKVTFKIFDETTKTLIMTDTNTIKKGIDWWISFGYAKYCITNNIRVRFYEDQILLFDDVFTINSPDLINPISDYRFNYDIHLSSFKEVFFDNIYKHNDIKVEKDDIVVDIGSNVGAFSHYALQKNAKFIYLCEPNPNCISIITKYFKNNSKLDINDIAICNKTGIDYLIVQSQHNSSGMSKLENIEANNPRDYSNFEKLQIKCDTFNNFIKNKKINHIDYLKIDCEGSEVFIFTDENKYFLKNNVSKIALEYHNKQKDNIIKYLKDLNYDVSEVVSNSNSEDFILGMIYAKNKNIVKKETTLFLAPHLSTGGSPAYLKWLIEKTIKQNIKPVVIEYCNYGSYDVQKKQIIELVGKDNFYTIGNHWDSDAEYNNKTPDLIKLIEQIRPTTIHLNEISEIFSLKSMTPSLLNYLYSKDRFFKLVETSHTSEFNFADKKYIPDRFDFCTPFHLEKTKHLNVEKNIVEMTIENKIRPKRSDALKKLGLSEKYFHVLNVGLFTRGKNQKYLYDLAEKLQHKKILFHFVGNTCYYDDCGITENQKALKNCILWNERDDVDTFMSCMDLFAFPSLKELNPISIKEALSWNMPCYINNLESYAGKYDNNPLINYIENDNLFNLLNNLPYV